MSTIEKAVGRLQKSAERPDNAQRGNIDGARDRHGPAGVSDKAPVPIDLKVLRKKRILPPAHLENTLRDEYRRIKRPLIANAFGRGAPALERGNVIMVTSALPGEGKTFTSINLAMSIARDPDISVIFVDGDVARANASGIFSIHDKPGLIDLLADPALAPSDVLLPTTIESLYLVPSGKRHTHSEELLSGSRMDNVVSSLATTRNTIVVFDSPPLLRTPESATLSKVAGQIVLVVKAMSTRKHQIQEAIDQLDPNKAINLILNQSLSGPGGDGYGGYYGGYYGETDRR